MNTGTEQFLEQSLKLEEQGDLLAAIGCCREAEQAFPDDVAVLWRLTQLYDKTEDYAQGNALFDRLLKIEPVYAVFFMAAKCKFKLKKYKEAARLFKAFLNTVPRDGEHSVNISAAELVLRKCTGEVLSEERNYSKDYVRFYGAGHGHAGFMCPEKYRDIVRNAVARGLRSLAVYVDQECFTKMLREAGMAEEEIERVYESINVMDDTYVEEHRD